MPVMMVQCINCSAVMRSDNFEHHIKTCESRQRCPSGQASYHQEKNDKIRTNEVNDDSSISDSDDNSSMDIGNQSNKGTMIQPHKNRLTSPVQESYQPDRLRETGEEDDGGNPKSKISNYTLKQPLIRKHSIWLPPSVRAIIVGKSGSGKTTLLSYLLLTPYIMDYNNLIVCGRSLHQPEYKVMKQSFDKGLSNTQVGA